jgi:hypothetical protein
VSKTEWRRRLRQKEANAQNPAKGTKYLRYYHLYLAGELRSEALEAAGACAVVSEEAFEEENVYVLVRKPRHGDE